MNNFCAKKMASLLFLVAGLLNFHSVSMASVTITRAIGGTLISADKAANGVAPAYTTLGDVVLTEGSVSDFSIGYNVTVRLSCPSGWSFNPSATVIATALPLNDISSTAVLSVSTTLITVQLTIIGNTNLDALTISGIEVRANEGGNIPCSANIIRGGTAIIYGCAAGTNLGSLSQTAGIINKLVITLPGQVYSDANIFSTSGNSGSATQQTAGVSFTTTKIRACDQFYNVVTSYAGRKTLSFSGPSNGLIAPSYTTSVSFASGVSSTVLTMILRKAESTIITVSDGTTTGPVSSPVTVNPGTVANFLVESSSGGNISSQVSGLPFTIRITAWDANNNSCTTGPNAFSGIATISSSGTLTSGNGSTATFSGGVLSSHSVTVSNQGNFIITANKSGGIQTGSSNAFMVAYPSSSLTSINPSCVNAGDPSFTLTATGTNFTGTSVVRINGSDRNTTYIDSITLDADLLAGDIAVPGTNSIAVFTPGTGITAPIILGMNTGRTANVTICQGSTYTLPDGIVENSAGTYVSHISNSIGCDSMIVTNLAVNSFPARTQNVSICQGSSFVLPDGNSQSLQGTYFSNVPNPPNCDSVITTNLSFYSSPFLSATPVQITCYGTTGSVVLNSGGGLAPYTFGQQSSTNLVAGTYNYSLTDANSCTANTSATIVPAPSRLLLSATPVQIACSGETGNVVLVYSGGTLPYTLNSTPTDSLSAGSYSYQLTDNKGCIANAATVIRPAPSPLAAVASASNTPCGSSTGVVSVSVSGGTDPYTYSWNTTPPANSRSVSGLAIGTYTVIVTDHHGCTVSKTATVGQSNLRAITITGGTGICPGATTTLCASAGFASYSWSTGETTTCITVATADTFMVTATDSLGCNSTRSVVTNESQTPTCNITGGTLCPNSSLTLRATTGYASYLWSNGIRTSYNSVRSAGTYTVAIRSAAGCTSSCSYTVNSPMRVTVSKIDGKCSNEFKGSATVTASSGIAPYTYLWNTGATTSAISGLSGGTYSIRVTDAGGCVSINTVTILINKTTNDYSSQVMNFNNTAVDSLTYIWFSAVVNINYTGNYPVMIGFSNQNIYSSKFNLNPPNAKLIITNAVTQASTTFTGGEWVTTAPPDLSGNYFVSGYAYLVASPIPASLSSIRWKGIWTASSSCVTHIHWKWSAAAYTEFTTDHTLLVVNSVDDVTASPFGNGDFAGTPENYAVYCTAGALSNGPSDYTGVYSAVINRSPCSTPDACNIGLMKLSGNNLLKDDSNFFLNAYPNPFFSITNIEFKRIDKPCHMKIFIYNIYGQRVRNLFDQDIEAGVSNTIAFDAGDLPTGIYFCRLVTEDKETGGTLYLRQ